MGSATGTKAADYKPCALQTLVCEDKCPCSITTTVQKSTCTLFPIITTDFHWVPLQSSLLAFLFPLLSHSQIFGEVIPCLPALLSHPIPILSFEHHCGLAFCRALFCSLARWYFPSCAYHRLVLFACQHFLHKVNS